MPCYYYLFICLSFYLHSINLVLMLEFNLQLIFLINKQKNLNPEKVKQLDAV